MATIDDAAGILAKLAGGSPTVEPARCTKVRHKASTCAACMDACPTGAITVEDNELVVNRTFCLGCGACASACPTQALCSKVSLSHFEELIDTALAADEGRAAAPMDPDHEQAASSQIGSSPFEHEEDWPKPSHSDIPKPALSETTGSQPDAFHQIWLACSKHALSKLDDKHLGHVPCIGALDESHLVHFAARGIDELHLLTSQCAECPLAHATQQFEATKDEALKLMNAWGLALNVSQHEELADEPPAFPYQDGVYSRRDLFGSFKSSIKTSGYAVAESAIENYLDANEQAPRTWRERLIDPMGGGLKKFGMPRQGQLLDDLYAVNPEPATTLAPLRRWGQPEINHDLCNGCGMCSFFCPTGALSSNRTVRKLNTSSTSVQIHEFHCCDCVGCHLCEDACLQNALKLSSPKSARQLFELEPTRI